MLPISDPNLDSLKSFIPYLEKIPAPIFSYLHILAENEVEMSSDEHEDSDFEGDSICMSFIFRQVQTHLQEMLKTKIYKNITYSNTKERFND